MLLDDIKLDAGRCSLDADSIYKVKAKLFVVFLDVIVGLFHIVHLLMRFPGVEWGYEYEWYL